MSVAAVLLPLFVEVALTFVLLFAMMGTSVGAVLRGEVKAGDVAEPERTEAARAFQNELQLPVLFYVLVVLALFTRQADLLFVIMSWLFVISRVIHALADTASRRRFAFAVGAVILLIMWIIFAVRILAGWVLPPSV